VKDFSGKNPRKWALEVVKHLFTNDEIMENTLELSNHTRRGALSPNRVKKLKASMNKRFDLNVAKSDFWWSEVAEGINQKGRNLKKEAAKAAELASLKEVVAAAQEKSLTSDNH